MPKTTNIHEEISKAETLAEIENLCSKATNIESQKFAIDKWEELLIKEFKISKTLSEKRNLLKSALRHKEVASKLSKAPTPIKTLIANQICILLSSVNNSKKK